MSRVNLTEGLSANGGTRPAPTTSKPNTRPAGQSVGKPDKERVVELLREVLPLLDLERDAAKVLDLLADYDARKGGSDD